MLRTFNKTMSLQVFNHIVRYDTTRYDIFMCAQQQLAASLPGSLIYSMEPKRHTKMKRTKNKNRVAQKKRWSQSCGKDFWATDDRLYKKLIRKWDSKRELFTTTSYM